jgi:hypothetical protein
MEPMIPLWKILRERIKLKILRQQIFSLTKIKGGWLKTTHLFCWFEIETSKHSELCVPFQFASPKQTTSTALTKHIFTNKPRGFINK